MNNVSIDSEINRSLKIIGIIFLILSGLPLLGVFNTKNKTDLIICIVLFFVFLIFALLMITYRGRIVITSNQYSMVRSILGFNITSRTDISGWKIIRLSARTHHSSGNTFSPRKFELDLSPHVGKEWSFDDVFISGHFQFEFNSDPMEVAEMLINLQEVTGFDVELDKSAEKLFGVTYRMMKIERRV